MILHIIDDEKFLVSAIALFEAIYPNENVFLVGIDTGGFNNHEELKESTKIFFKKVSTTTYINEYKKLTKAADLVMFHNVYKTYKLKLLKKFKIKAKTAWFFWGAELYGLNPFYKALLPNTKKAYLRSLPLTTYLKKTLFSRAKKYYYWGMFKTILKQNRLDYTLTNITEDIDLLESYTNHKTNRGWFTYYSFDQKLKGDTTTESKKHILIGNSSSETNNHIDAFHLIQDKDLENRNIYIPLNYGDDKYRKLVINQAEKAFGDKSKPITDFLSLEDYTTII